MDFQQAIATLRYNGANVCNICVTFDKIRNSLPASSLPQLYFDQLRDAVRQIIISLRTPVANRKKVSRRNQIGMNGSRLNFSNLTIMMPKA
jgi:hypothetical protein